MISTRDEREVLESPKTQGISTHEKRAYSFDFTDEGVVTIEGTPTVTLYDWTVDPPLDVSASLLTATTATATGLVATMNGKVQNLTDGKEYRLYCRTTHDGGQSSELYCRIFGRA